jgi:hypothetical protein
MAKSKILRVYLRALTEQTCKYSINWQRYEHLIKVFSNDYFSIFIQEGYLVRRKNDQFK